MKKIDFALMLLVLGTLAYQVPTTWAAEINNLLSADGNSRRGISAHETVMKNPEVLTGLQPGTRVRIHGRDFRQGSSYRDEQKAI